MKKTLSAVSAFLFLLPLARAQFNSEIHFNNTPLYQNQVIFNPYDELGEVKAMNGTTGGPDGIVTPELYKGANLPYARLHDVSASHGGPVKIVEVMHIFPDFDADENDPASYRFALTDQYLEDLVATGTKVIYRLNNNHHEPYNIKKYGPWPPKSYEKWARICSHIIAHYNDGWADGYHMGIEYWEILNEPDLDQRLLPASENILEKDRDKVGKVMRYECYPHAWGGTMEEYYNFMAVVISTLQKDHPDCKIGGPSGAQFIYDEPFIVELKKRGVKPDFFSWHRYSSDPRRLACEGVLVKSLLNGHGWGDIPVFLAEWNYSSKAGDRKTIRGAAFVAAAMCEMQEHGCTDVMNYYDMRPHSSYNGAFNKMTGHELAPYYILRNWGKLLEYGTQIRTITNSISSDVFASAAKDADGHVRLMIVRFNNDRNVYENKVVTVTLPEGFRRVPKCFVTDSYHLNTEYPVELAGGEQIKIDMEPNSVFFMQF